MKTPLAPFFLQPCGQAKKNFATIHADAFQSVPASFSGPINHAADDLAADVRFCGWRDWNGVRLLAADFALPGGIELLIMASDCFPGIPPLAFTTETGETRQLNLDWDISVDPDTRLTRALRQHFHGNGPFRSVFGTPDGLAITDDENVAVAAGWKRIHTSAKPMAADAERALHARSGGLLSKELSHRHVLIAGLGSGGSYVAEQMVRAGVGELTLIDPDHVESSNLSRTSYRWDDVGMEKTEALARHLHHIRPDVKLHTHRDTLGSLGDPALLECSRECDLLLALTDDPSAQALLNHAAYLAGTPAVFAGLYAGARGGEVILCVPGRTPCYRCSTGGIRELGEYGGDGGREIDYGTGRLAAETALAADIHHLDSATVKLSLSLLLRDLPEASLSRFAEDAIRHRFHYLCLSMAPDYWFFNEIFRGVSGQYAYQGLWLTTESEPDCPVCGNSQSRVGTLQAVACDIDPTQFQHLT